MWKSMFYVSCATSAGTWISIENIILSFERSTQRNKMHNGYKLGIWKRPSGGCTISNVDERNLIIPLQYN